MEIQQALKSVGLNISNEEAKDIMKRCGEQLFLIDILTLQQVMLIGPKQILPAMTLFGVKPHHKPVTELRFSV